MNSEYTQLINELKESIVHSRYATIHLANRESLLLYLKIGKRISEKIVANKWGAKIIEQIGVDLQRKLPGVKGFSTRNLKNMRQFYQAYHQSSIGQTVSAQLKIGANRGIIDNQTMTTEIMTFFSISFSHHLLILNGSRSEAEKFFYIQKAATEGWSLLVLEHQIASNLFEMQGSLPSNFSTTLSADIRSSAQNLFKDEYLIDYLKLSDSEDEKEIEDKIVANIRDFILRMGIGFSFIGNQYPCCASS